MRGLNDRLYYALHKLAGAGDMEDNVDQLRGMTDQQAQASGDVPGSAMQAATSLGGQQLATTFGTKVHDLRRAAQTFAAFQKYIKTSTNPNEKPPEIAHLPKSALEQAWQTFAQTPQPGITPGDIRRTKAILESPANLSRLEAFAADITRVIDPAYEDLHRTSHLRQLVNPPGPQGPPQGPPPPPMAGPQGPPAPPMPPPGPPALPPPGLVPQGPPNMPAPPAGPPMSPPAQAPPLGA